MLINKMLLVAMIAKIPQGSEVWLTLTLLNVSYESICHKLLFTLHTVLRLLFKLMIVENIMAFRTLIHLFTYFTLISKSRTLMRTTVLNWLKFIDAIWYFILGGQ